MSSSRTAPEAAFKPDPLFGDPAFRPVLFGRPAAAGFAPGSDRPRADVAANAIDEASAPCTDAEHAELEEAAFEKGRASAEAEWSRCEQACGVLERAAAEMARVSGRMLHGNREQMIALAGEIARFWIGEELRLDPARLAGPVERALAECSVEGNATLHLHPNVLAALETSLPERLARWSDSLALELVADPGIAADGFRIVSGACTLESDLDGLVPRLRDALAEAFESSAGEGEACR